MGNTGKKRYFLHTPKRYVSAKATESLYMDLLKETAALCMATGVGFLFRKLGFVDADIIMGYLFSILILSLYTTRRYIAVSAAVLSVFLFDWFFVHPYYSLTFYSGEYSVTFGIMLLFPLLFPLCCQQEGGRQEKVQKLCIEQSFFWKTAEKCGVWKT